MAGDLLQMLEQSTVPEIPLPEDEVQSQATSTETASSSEVGVMPEVPVEPAATSSSSTDAEVPLRPLTVNNLYV